MARVYLGADKAVALSAEVQVTLKAHAEELAARARTLAETHDDSGEYARSIHVEHGRVDWYVVSDDPNAVSKEFGRTGARGRGASQGVFALTRAMNGDG
jgi:Family of unknown function (DUF5403)